jgi:hypothetical protein
MQHDVQGRGRGGWQAPAPAKVSPFSFKISKFELSTLFKFSFLIWPSQPHILDDASHGTRK